jgi:hypothetical protein
VRIAHIISLAAACEFERDRVLGRSCRSANGEWEVGVAANTFRSGNG